MRDNQIINESLTKIDLETKNQVDINFYKHNVIRDSPEKLLSTLSIDFCRQKAPTIQPCSFHLDSPMTKDRIKDLQRTVISLASRLL